MNIRAVPDWKAAALNKGRDIAVARRPPPRMTRRQFGRTVAGTPALGGALGSGFFDSGLAKASNSFAVVPYLAVVRFSAVLTTCLARMPSIPPMRSRFTITNLNGFVGLAYISGMVTQTNTHTGETLPLPFINSDMRLMQSFFRGADGGVHQGTFALV